MTTSCVLNRVQRTDGALLLMAFCLTAFGNASQAASLYEALATTYATNPTLEAARAQLRATDDGVPQVLSEWRPTVLGTVQGGHEWDNQNKPVTLNEEAYPRSYGVTVRQPIFDGFGTVAGTSQAENLVRAGRAQLASTDQTVLLNAVTAYMNVVRDAAVLEFNRNNEKVLQAQLEATRPRYEVGELTRTDVAQAEARLQGAVAARIQAVGQLTASRANYREVIGEEPVDAKMPTERLQLPSSCEESVALSRRAPEVQAAVLRERAAKDDIDVQFQRDAADGRDRRQLSTPA